VPEKLLKILLDQNVPQAVSGWLKGKLPGWEIRHVNELGFAPIQLARLPHHY